MQSNLYSENKAGPKDGLSYGEVIKELTSSTKELIQSEMDLVKTDLKSSIPNIAKHSARTAAFGALMAVSVFPFLAFLVIALGNLMNDNYWLSSLIVAVVVGAFGFVFMKKSLVELKKQDLTFMHTRTGITKGVNTVSSRFKDIVGAAKGESNESNRIH